MPFSNRSKNVNIKKTTYSMATTDGRSAEIIMYGDIYEQQPTDWWGDPIDGQYITLSEFLEDLQQISGCKKITIRMNSYGGDAGVSNTIHNRLRDLARGGAKLTCIVDGVAMSGGSLIMCACDTVKVNPSSLIMIHKCWGFMYGGYNADELREIATEQDAWDKMQAEIYARKTGLSKDEILGMMTDTTYMTGREAVEKGFADELLEDAEPLNIAASADGRILFVGERQMHLTPGMFAPDNIPTVKSEASATVETNTKPGKSGTEGGTPTMARNLEELRAENPELAAQLEAEARAATMNAGSETPPPATASPAVDAVDPVQAERQRIQDIDQLACLFDAETVQAAKYGEKACSAQEMVYRAAQAAAKQGKKFMFDLEADTGDSGAQNVSATAVTQEDDTDNKTPQQRKAEAKANVKALLGKKEE